MPQLPANHPEIIFSLASGLAMLSWLALALSPTQARWAPRVRFIAGRLVPLLLAVVYVLLFAVHGMGDGGYDSLAAVQRLLAVPGLLTAGWLHYLAFDLFVGAWIADRAGTLGMPHLLVLPLLALTFTFGPAGLLAFAMLRPLWLRRAPARLPA
ncbi:MAG: ABA4-like family protein [Rhizobacter sp.]|nr:ABA4-like family protein [Rhizobacter sp.]